MKRSRIVILVISLLFILSLSSCKHNKITYLGYHTVSENNMIFVGCKVNRNNSLNKKSYISISYARSKDFEFTEKYSIFYYSESTGSVKLFDCEDDFGTNKKRIIKYADKYYEDENSYFYRAGFNDNTYQKWEIDYTKFSSGEGMAYIILCEEANAPTNLEDVNKLCSFLLPYECSEKTLTFKF